MGEGGLVERFFGGGESEEGEAEKLDTGTDPIAAVVAIDAARFDPELSRQAVDYLREQKRFVEIQSEHLHEQRALQLAHLKLRRTSEFLRVGLQLLLTLIGTLAGLWLVFLLYDAFTSRNVVVDAFSAPPVLSGRGVSGEVVASGVLDSLQALQDATRGPRKGLSTKGAWSSDIKVELPETGVSIGEINRILHERLGHDVHIGGDLVETASGGLALTVRGDGVPAKTFTGGASDLETLTRSAAEYIYGRSQPWLFAVYLISTSRNADAIAFLPGAFAGATTDPQRAELANVWGAALTGLNKPDDAIAKYRLTMSLSRPKSQIWWKAWANIIIAITPSGPGEEKGWRESIRYLDAAKSARGQDRPEPRLLAGPATYTWDLPQILEGQLQNASYNGGAGASASGAGPSIADAYAQMHDSTQAARYVVASDPNSPDTKMEAAMLLVYAAMNGGDPVPAIKPMEASYKQWLTDPELSFQYPYTACFLGYVDGLAGHFPEAEALFKRGGDTSTCYAYHGDVLAHARDLAGAERVWAAGLKTAPDLPLIYLRRGLSEFSRGDLDAAQADFAIAHAKAPHFADPLKGWGDVLARHGRWKDALAKYDEALKCAPAWTELRQARAVATKRTG